MCFTGIMNNGFDKKNRAKQESDFINTPKYEEAKRLRQKYHEYLLSFSDNDSRSDKIDLALIYPETTDKQELINQVDDLKKCLDSFRPFNPIQAENLAEALDIEYTYDSNRIEGNTITLSETALILQKGITIGGKTIVEHLEVINHRDALEYMKEIAQKKIVYSEKELLEIHSLILRVIDTYHAGFYRRERVFITGTRYTPPNPLKVPQLMTEYFEYFERNKNILHPVILSADMHEKLVTIHPFINGNGRTSRLVMNLLLMQAGFPITIISSENNKRNEYYNSLKAVQLQEDTEKFRIFILQAVKSMLFRYIDAVSINGQKEEEGKGLYFFEKIEPFIDKG